MDSDDLEAAQMELTAAVEALAPYLSVLRALGGIQGEESRLLLARGVNMLQQTLDRDDREEATAEELRQTAEAMRQLHKDMTRTVIPGALDFWKPAKNDSTIN